MKYFHQFSWVLSIHPFSPCTSNPFPLHSRHAVADAFGHEIRQIFTMPQLRDVLPTIRHTNGTSSWHPIEEIALHRIVIQRSSQTLTTFKDMWHGALFHFEKVWRLGVFSSVKVERWGSHYPHCPSQKNWSLRIHRCRQDEWKSNSTPPTPGTFHKPACPPMIASGQGFEECHMQKRQSDECDDCDDTCKTWTWWVYTATPFGNHVLVTRIGVSWCHLVEG